MTIKVCSDCGSSFYEILLTDGKCRGCIGKPLSEVLENSEDFSDDVDPLDRPFSD